MHGDAGSDEGLEALEEKTFPDVSRTLIWEYTKFSREVFARVQSQHPATHGRLEKWNTETFEIPKNKQDCREVMTVLSEVVEGKRYTAWLRAIGRMRQPLIGAGGHRDGPRPKRTKAQIALDELRERAAEEFPALKNDITEWLDAELHVYLEDHQIVELKDLVHDFRTKLSDPAYVSQGQAQTTDRWKRVLTHERGPADDKLHKRSDRDSSRRKWNWQWRESAPQPQRNSCRRFRERARAYDSWSSFSSMTFTATARF